MMRIATLADAERRYSVIYADPPWAYQCWSGPSLPSRVADAHYDTMPIDDLRTFAIHPLAADDCALFMWITWPTMQDALALGSAWGFEYKTCAFAWVKQNASGTPFTGLGYWTRANSEVCLLFTRGKPKRKSKDVSQVILAQRGKHSAKPLEVYDRIERLMDGPYLELFARRHKPGWDVWGNEAPDTPEEWQQSMPLFHFSS